MFFRTADVEYTSRNTSILQTFSDPEIRFWQSLAYLPTQLGPWLHPPAPWRFADVRPAVADAKRRAFLPTAHVDVL